MGEKVLCGVDIGGTKLSVGLVTPGGRLIDSTTTRDHVRKTPEEIVAQIESFVRKLLDRNRLSEADIGGVGVGTAGHLRYRDGVLITMSNLKGFRDFPIRDRLQSCFTAPVYVDNDANAQAFGEFKYGAGTGFSDMVFITVSTQIGAGIILDSRLFRGMTGTAGEIGHTIVEPGSDLICPCGNAGCLIAVASGVALPASARKKVESGMSSPLFAGKNFDFSAVTGELIKQGLETGDELCVSIVDDFARYIGIGVYNVFQIFNPRAIVLGGGLLSWGDVFFDGITTRFKSLAREMVFDDVAIVRAKIGPHSGVIGAASLALEEA
ncbi:MAG TPA: ROK family protein [Spirochaetia bacterium]|nr:ROK family protein [Spirochaetia bacterium]